MLFLFLFIFALPHFPGQINSLSLPIAQPPHPRKQVPKNPPFDLSNTRPCVIYGGGSFERIHVCFLYLQFHSPFHCGSVDHASQLPLTRPVPVVPLLDSKVPNIRPTWTRQSAQHLSSKHVQVPEGNREAHWHKETSQIAMQITFASPGLTKEKNQGTLEIGHKERERQVKAMASTANPLSKTRYRFFPEPTIDTTCFI